MTDPENEDEILRLEEAFPRLVAEAFAATRARVLASGLSVLQSENGAIYEVFPDGRKVLVKRIDPPVPMIPGTRFKIR